MIDKHTAAQQLARPCGILAGENSSAVEAGVKGGDILLAINGRPAAEFTLDQIRTMFMQDGKEYLLSLKREGKVLQLKLKLKRIHNGPYSCVQQR